VVFLTMFLTMLFFYVVFLTMLSTLFLPIIFLCLPTSQIRLHPPQTHTHTHTLTHTHTHTHAHTDTHTHTTEDHIALLSIPDQGLDTSTWPGHRAPYKGCPLHLAARE